jgi:hypothetical protein
MCCKEHPGFDADFLRPPSPYPAVELGSATRSPQGPLPADGMCWRPARPLCAYVLSLQILPCTRQHWRHRGASTTAGARSTHLEKPCSFLRIASEDGRSARSSGVRQCPEAPASSSAVIDRVSASMVDRAAVSAALARPQRSNGQLNEKKLNQFFSFFLLASLALSAVKGNHLCPQNGFSVPHTVYYIAGRVAAPCWLPGADLTGRRE